MIVASTVREATVGVVVGEAVRAEEDGERAVGILVDPHAGFDEVWPEAARRELQGEPAPFEEGVVVADLALVLGAEDLAPGAGAVGHEGRAGLLGGDGEAGVVRRDVDLGEPAVGRLHGRDAGQPQLLGQAILEGAEGPLGAAARLGRVGGDVLDAELGQRPADLRQLLFRDFAAGLGRVEVVRPPVGVKRAEQAVPPTTSRKPWKLEAVPSSSTRKIE